MQDKGALRREYKAKRDSMGKMCREYSSEICKRCTSLREFIEADTVLLYCAKGSEVDLSRLFETARSMGKTVGYPRCIDKGTMLFFRVSSLSELERGYFGIFEPSENAPLCKTDGAVCFVPGLAYDKNGYRLGYGGGYYDRFLSEFSGVSIGVTYEELMAESLPKDSYDQKTDYIITERQVKRTVEN